eukprot:1497128-Pyramimonas_sp.AAC.1
MAFCRAGQCARERASPQLALSDLDSASARTSAKKATGVDNFTVDDVARLPRAGRQACVDLFNF